MNLDTFEADPTEAVALLQPYVDGELSEDERELVAAQIATNPDYEAMVAEQREVQALLRGLEDELAPPGLRERIAVDLDAVDAQRREAERKGWLAPVVGRIKAFGKGAMLMVPAVAAAGVLFFVANNSGWIAGAVGDAHIDGGMASSLRVAPQRDHAAPAKTVAEPVQGADDAELPSAEELGFAVQVAPPRALPRGVALVGDSVQRPGSSAMVRYSYGGGGIMVDHQRRAGVAPLRGAAVEYSAHEYHLGRDATGRAFVEFHLDAVHHSLMLDGEPASVGGGISAQEPDFASLLSVAAALRGALD